MSQQSTTLEDAARYAYAGTVAPQRQRWVTSHGVRLAVVEWGEPDAQPLLLAHGGSDFARTFDGFAPLLAKEGFRVVSWDHRGHGDSDPAALYSWEADLRDALAVLESTSTDPLPLVGHSKGAGILLDLALFFPERVTRLVSLDGLPSTQRRSRRDLSQEQRVQGRDRMLAQWLDHRRRAHDVRRKPGTVEDLARRRGEMNPRLPFEWLCYLVTAGAQQESDGWRWKLDPALRMGGFGPWRPGWILEQLGTLAVPMLGLVSRIVEPMGWGSSAAELRPHLAAASTVEDVEDLGHFLHIEAPARIADRVLAFLGEPRGVSTPRTEVAGPSAGGRGPERPSDRSRAMTTAKARRLQHGRVELALWSLRVGASERRPLLLLHELGGRSPQAPPAGVEGWPGPVWALDFTGHGDSTVPAGGGYTAEVLMADADAALASLGEATVAGWGLGAYIALLIAGARPALVKGAVLADGAGLEGGGPHGGTLLVRAAFEPAPGAVLGARPGAVLGARPAAPDPFALRELASDARPPGYAQLFARQAVHLSGVADPIVVAAQARPPWLAGVLGHPGVVEDALATALARLAVAAVDRPTAA